jgi:dTMP kinase
MKLENLRNKLIVFEGSDKTGKTSVAKLLVDELNGNGIPAIFTFQPGDPNWGTEAVLMRSLCKDKRHNLHPLANLFAFLLDRVEQTSKVVKPALDEGKTVVSDRWWHSTIAYQFHGKKIITDYNLDEKFATTLNKVASMYLEPDYVFYFPVQLEVDRKDDINDQFDNSEEKFKKRVNAAYKMLATQLDFIKVLPGKDAEETLNNILGIDL